MKLKCDFFMFQSFVCKSRIGRKILKYPSEVSISVNQQICSVTGPKGSLSIPLHPFININISKADTDAKTSLSVSVQNQNKKTQKQMWAS